MTTGWPTDRAPSLRSALLGPAPAASAELLSGPGYGMADPTPGNKDLSETFMSKAPANKSHCPPLLRDSPSALSLLKSHGINFAVH